MLMQKGIKQSLEDSIEKLELSIDRKEHKINSYSDGAAGNVSLFNKVKAEIGEMCEKDLSDIYYLLK